MSPIQYRTHYYQKLIKNLSKLLGAVYFQHLFLCSIQKLLYYNFLSKSLIAATCYFNDINTRVVNRIDSNIIYVFH